MGCLVTVIQKIKAREVLDSRGNPTVEAVVFSKKFHASAIVPSGASTGIHEAIELRDKQKRYRGKGVLKAIKNIAKIEKVVKGKNLDQKQLDNKIIELDGTENKSKIGANAMLAVSLAFARVCAKEKNKSLFKHIQSLSKTKKAILPRPFFNVINGGKHADNPLAFQEFMIAPKAKSFSERLRIGSEVYHELKSTIGKKYGKSSTNVGDEGGFAPNIQTPEQALDLLTKSVDQLGYSKKVDFAMDVAASDFYDIVKNKYYVSKSPITKEKMQTHFEKLVKKYPIISIEDPFAENNFGDFADLTKSIGKKVQIVGDDLLVTNPKRIKMAIEAGACNALLLKVNQIGTLTEAIQANALAKKAGWNTMVSHRSGETEDTFIADLAVGLGTGQIKSGAPCRGERTAKYNQLLRIEEVSS